MNMPRSRCASMLSALAVASATLCLSTTSQAAVYPTVAAANASASGTAVEVDNVTISNVLNFNSINGYNLNIQDATGGTQAFRFPTTAFAGFMPAVGQIVNLTGTNSPYMSNPEFSNAGASVTLVGTTTFVPPTATAAAANAANGTPLLGETISLLGVTLATSGTTTGTKLAVAGTYSATDATGSVVLYIPSSYSASAALSGQPISSAPVNVTGYVDLFTPTNGTPYIEIYPTAITSTPEPASLGIFFAGASLLTTRRRRWA